MIIVKIIVGGWVVYYLHRDAMLSAVFAVVCVCVCVCVCLCVCLSVRHTPVLYRTAKHRITQITPHDSVLTIVF